MSKEKASERISANVVSSKKKNYFLPVIIVVCIGITFAAIIMAVSVISNNNNNTGAKPHNANPGNVVVTADNIEEVINELQETARTPVGFYEVNMNYDWTFPDSFSPSADAYVGNSVNNRYTVFFTLTLGSSADVIYTSPYIPVGSHMADICLDTDLAAGTYDGIVTYHLVDSQNIEMSSVSVTVTITIQN